VDWHQHSHFLCATAIYFARHWPPRSSAGHHCDRRRQSLCHVCLAMGCRQLWKAVIVLGRRRPDAAGSGEQSSCSFPFRLTGRVQGFSVGRHPKLLLVVVTWYFADKSARSCLTSVCPLSYSEMIKPCALLGGHWGNAGAGWGTAHGSMDSTVLYVLLHLRVCLVVGAAALAVRCRSAVSGDPISRTEHSDPHQPAVLLCHRPSSLHFLLESLVSLGS
jgi:hypothetical protein